MAFEGSTYTLRKTDYFHKEASVGRITISIDQLHSGIKFEMKRVSFWKLITFKNKVSGGTNVLFIETITLSISSQLEIVTIT